MTATLALLVVGFASLNGCATSRIIPLSGTGGGGGQSVPTPSGAYNVIVTGITSGVTHQVNLNLTIQ